MSSALSLDAKLALHSPRSVTEDCPSDALPASGYGLDSEAYSQIRSDLMQFPQRGRPSWHFTRLLRHVKLFPYEFFCYDQNLEQTHHPVEVLNPRAFEGRGFL